MVGSHEKNDLLFLAKYRVSLDVRRRVRFSIAAHYRQAAHWSRKIIPGLICLLFANVVSVVVFEFEKYHARPKFLE